MLSSNLAATSEAPHWAQTSFSVLVAVLKVGQEMVVIARRMIFLSFRRLETGLVECLVGGPARLFVLPHAGHYPVSDTSLCFRNFADDQIGCDLPGALSVFLRVDAHDQGLRHHLASFALHAPFSSRSRIGEMSGDMLAKTQIGFRPGRIHHRYVDAFVVPRYQELVPTNTGTPAQ